MPRPHRPFPLLSLLVISLAVASACKQSGSASSSEAQPAANTASAPAEVAHPLPDAAPHGPALPEAAGVAYLELLIGGADPEQTLPMIVAIHGLGDAPEPFAALVRDLDVPARVIIPRGLDRYAHGGYAWFPFRARDPDVDALADGIGHAADRVAAALAELIETRPTRGLPVITGFSQGGMLAFALAVHHQEVVSSAVAISGWLPPPLWPKSAPSESKRRPIVALHGLADQVVAYEPTRAAVERLRELGYIIRLEAYPDVQHGLTPQVYQDLHGALADAVRNTATSSDR